MKRKIAGALRRLAGKLDRPVPVYPMPDPRVVALEKQTEAIRSLSTTLKDQVTRGVPEAVTGVCAAIIGPMIVRAVNETRGDGVADTEILDTLVGRLADGWW